MKEDVRSILSKYTKPEELIDALEDVQDRFGYVSEKNMQAISQKLGVPLVKIVGVVTFYSAFKQKIPGKHVLRICSGTACHVKGSAALKDHLKRKLGVTEGETTKDGVFTLESVNCIGACAKAPSMMIGEKVYGELTREKIDKIISEYK